MQILQRLYQQNKHTDTHTPDNAHGSVSKILASLVCVQPVIGGRPNQSAGCSMTMEVLTNEIELSNPLLC